jgi:hypothetical protein
LSVNFGCVEWVDVLLDLDCSLRWYSDASWIQCISSINRNLCWIDPSLINGCTLRIRVRGTSHSATFYCLCSRSRFIWFICLSISNSSSDFILYD